MEQALFSPPLSKQRVEYAVQHIRDFDATSLVNISLPCLFNSVFQLLYYDFTSLLALKVDFGCGSGSLLDSLLDFSTSLQRIVGVDISLKGLSRAAKVACIFTYLR